MGSVNTHTVPHASSACPICPCSPQLVVFLPFGFQKAKCYIYIRTRCICTLSSTFQSLTYILYQLSRLYLKGTFSPPYNITFPMSRTASPPDRYVKCVVATILCQSILIFAAVGMYLLFKAISRLCIVLPSSKAHDFY